MLKAINRSTLRPLARSFSTSPSRRLPIEMEKVHTTERLARLRELMKQHKVDIYRMSPRCYLQTAD